MPWVGVAIAVAGAASSIIGMRRGSGGLAENLQAIHISLDAILKNQQLIGESIVAISSSIEDLHRSVQELPSAVLDKISQSDVQKAANLLFSKIRLLKDFPEEDKLHEELLEHFRELHAASIGLDVAFRDGRPTIHAFRPSTLAMSAAFTACLFLKSIDKLPRYFPRLYNEIYNSTINILTGLNDPAKGVPALIDQAVGLVREKSSEIAKLESLFKDPLLWARQEHMIDLASPNAAAIEEIPGVSRDSENDDAYYLAQVVKMRSPNATESVIANTAYDAGGFGREGEGSNMRGYTIVRYTETVFELEVRSRLTILAERFLTVEFQEAAFAHLQKVGTYYWDYRDDYDNSRRTGRVPGSDPKTIEYSDAAGGSHTARNISEAKFNSELNQYRDMLQTRNNIAVLAAQYEAIRNELEAFLVDSSVFRSIPDGPIEAFA